MRNLLIIKERVIKKQQARFNHHNSFILRKEEMLSQVKHKMLK